MKLRERRAPAGSNKWPGLLERARGHSSARPCAGHGTRAAASRSPLFVCSRSALSCAALCLLPTHRRVRLQARACSDQVKAGPAALASPACRSRRGAAPSHVAFYSAQQQHHHSTNGASQGYAVRILRPSADHCLLQRHERCSFRCVGVTATRWAPAHYPRLTRRASTCRAAATRVTSMLRTSTSREATARPQRAPRRASRYPPTPPSATPAAAPPPPPAPPQSSSAATTRRSRWS